MKGTGQTGKIVLKVERQTSHTEVTAAFDLDALKISVPDTLSCVFALSPNEVVTLPATTSTGTGLITRSHIFSGESQILTHAAALEELACSTGQAASMHGLAYIINQQYASTKIPHLFCLYAKPPESSQRSSETLIGAVLLFEYRVGRFATGFISTGDSFGVRTVIGPEDLRLFLVAQASVAMLVRGARLILISFKHCPDVVPRLLSTGPSHDTILWNVASRKVHDHLRLASTFDESLARIGKRTRTHLRYYRRRLSESVDTEFIADVRGLIDPFDAALLSRLNNGSLDVIVQAIFDDRFRATLESRGGFVSGLRLVSDGTWISLIGGWRQDGTTLIEWQMNSLGYEKFSLGTVLRSYLIEQETALKTTRLAFTGGTSHSMGHAFQTEQVVDLLARRRSSFIAALFIRMVPALYEKFQLLGKRGNLLGNALRECGQHWRATNSLHLAIATLLSEAPPFCAAADTDIS